mgnify:CR=1 FL=1
MKKYEELIEKAKTFSNQNQHYQAIKIIRKAKKKFPGINEIDELLYETSIQRSKSSNNINFLLKISSFLLVIFHGIFRKKNNFRTYEKIWLLNPTNKYLIRKFLNNCVINKKNRNGRNVMNLTLSFTKILPWHDKLIKELFKHDNIEKELDFRKKIKKEFPNNKKNNEYISQIEQIILNQNKKINDNSLLLKIDNEPYNEENHMEYVNFLVNKRSFNMAIKHLEKYLYINNPRLQKRLLQIKLHDINLKLAKAEDDDNDYSLIKSLKTQSDKIRIDKYKLNINENPDDKQLKYEFGKLLLDLKMYQESIDQFNEIISYNKRRVRILINLSEAYRAINRNKDAMKILEIALDETLISNEKTEILKNIKNLENSNC